MQQSKKWSHYETWVNISVGLLIIYLSLMFILPLPVFGGKAPVFTSVGYCALMALIAYWREYWIRRWFNNRKPGSRLLQIESMFGGFATYATIVFGQLLIFPFFGGYMPLETGFSYPIVVMAANYLRKLGIRQLFIPKTV